MKQGPEKHISQISRCVGRTVLMNFLRLGYGEAEESQNDLTSGKETICNNSTSFQDEPDTLHLTRPVRKLETQIALEGLWVHRCIHFIFI